MSDVQYRAAYEKPDTRQAYGPLEEVLGAYFEKLKVTAKACLSLPDPLAEEDQILLSRNPPIPMQPLHFRERHL